MRGYTKYTARITPLFVTLLALATFLVVILAYNHRQLDPGQKRAYIGISTALILILSLSTTKGFEELAKVYSAQCPGKRWYAGLPKEDRHSVDHASEWFSILRLLYTSLRWKRWRIVICCSLWGLSFLLAQSVLAAMSPLVEVQDGSNFDHTYIKPQSNIKVPDLGCYHHWYGNRWQLKHFQCKSVGSYSDSDLFSQQAIAHRYGDSGYDSLTAHSRCGDYAQLSGREPFRYFCRRDENEFAYRFLEYHPNDAQDIFPRTTNRIIRASSGTCVTYEVQERDLIQVPDGSNKLKDISAWNYTYGTKDGLPDGNIIIPVAYETQDGTTYIYRGKEIPENETEWSCGKRCLWMWAHLNAGPSFNDPKRLFYKCPITVSEVENVDPRRPEQELSDGVARLAIASIALQGRKGGDWQKWMQYQFYPIGTAWELHRRPAQDAGRSMAEFAIASLSTLALQNARITASGDQPNLASYLNFSWWAIIVLALFVGLLHIGLFGTMTYLAARSPQEHHATPLIESSPLSHGDEADNADGHDSPSEHESSSV